jgi:hypothetical protein
MSDVDNPCFRCGKQRIVVKVKKERINGSLVITTTTCCSDPECQKLLDKELKKDKDARARFVNLSKNPANLFNKQKKGIVLGKKVKAV